MPALRVLTLLKTSEGGQWIVPLLAGLAERGHTNLVLLPDPAGPLGRLLAAHGVPSSALPVPLDARRPLQVIRGLYRLRRIVVEWQPDVVHYQLYLSALIGRLATLGLRRVTTVHMVPGPLYLEHSLIRTAERLLSRLDRTLIASSQYTHRRYLELGYPEHRLRLASYGVDLDHFQPASPRDRAEARRTLGLPMNAFVAVCAAYFYPPKRTVFRGLGIKGHDSLLQAWQQYLAAGGDGFLVLAGSGWGPRGREYEHRMHELAHLLGIDGTIVWTGRLEDVRLAYRAADISVSPSLSENHGAAGEASAMGLPTLASRAGGLPEMVREGQTGWLFDPGDAAGLARRLAEARSAVAAGVAPDMGRQARLDVEAHYDRRAAVARFCDLIEACRT